jgi:hypothetical protein
MLQDGVNVFFVRIVRVGEDLLADGVVSALLQPLSMLQKLRARLLSFEIPMIPFARQRPSVLRGQLFALARVLGSDIRNTRLDLS